MIPQHCEKCGRAYLLPQVVNPYSEDDESITCVWCGHKRWDNPIPVVVCVQQISGIGTGCLAIAKRAIEPHLGGWALIGGHMRNGETCEEAATREWREETGLEPGKFNHLTRSHANGRGHVLIAVAFSPIHVNDWRKARLCKENSDFGLWFGDPCDPVLAFPIHQQIAADWRRKMNRG